MLIGVPKEIKNHEYRVGMVPSSVRELVQHGHQVVVRDPGRQRHRLLRRDYVAAGATVLARPKRSSPAPR
jgi:alanine dehydrogenase